MQLVCGDCHVWMTCIAQEDNSMFTCYEDDEPQFDFSEDAKFRCDMCGGHWHGHEDGGGNVHVVQMKWRGNPDRRPPYNWWAGEPETCYLEDGKLAPHPYLP